MPSPGIEGKIALIQRKQSQRASCEDSGNRTGFLRRCLFQGKTVEKPKRGTGNPDPWEPNSPGAPDYRALFEEMSQGAFFQGADGVMQDVNAAALRMLGLSRDEFLQRPGSDPSWRMIDEDKVRLDPGDYPAALALSSGRPVREKILGIFNPQEMQYRWLRIGAFPLFRQGEVKPHQVLVTLEDQTELKQLRGAQRIAPIGNREYDLPNGMKQWSDEIFRIFEIDKIVERMQTPMCICHLEEMQNEGSLRLVNANPAATAMLRWARSEMIGSYIDEVFPGLRRDGVTVRLAEVVRSGKSFEMEECSSSDPRNPDGCFSFKAFPLPGDCLCLLFEDISGRKRAEAEKKSLEDQLFQSQKMESIGALAGGIAHDFNNMLGIILGCAEMTLSQMDPADPSCEYLEEIHRATEHSVAITRQLLAFARKQVTTPVVLDLDDAIAPMLKMLRRLIGEDIYLTWKPGCQGRRVRIDPSQLDQILTNLATNARDAIAGVGKISVETNLVIMDHHVSRQHPGLAAGTYVCLSVSDSGCGIPKDLQSRIFEPFMTTKEPGKGTGLGLSTVYGIVRQNNGFIHVYSEPGMGSAFRLYLPCIEEPVAEQQDAAHGRPAGGSETILLVEDEATYLNLIYQVLGSLGYTVLPNSSPGEAIRLAENRGGEIQLLVTDVVMPGMNGRDLANAVSAIQPGIRTLFVSGYSADTIADRGVLSGKDHFLQKPFSIRDLAAKVRETLDHPLKDL